jgi:hypothetical protein
MRRLMIAAVVVVAMSATLSAQEWTYTKSGDTMTDADRSFVFVQSDDRTGILAFRCMSDGVNIMFSWGKYLTDKDDTILVMYRFPPAPSTQYRGWDMPTGNSKSLAFAPMSLVPQLVKQMLAASVMTLRVQDSNDGEEVTKTFQLAGAGEAIQKLSCYKR